MPGIFFVSYSKNGNDNGWQGNGPLGVKSYSVTSFLNNGTESSTITYTDPDTGTSASSTATYATQGAIMQQTEVRLQTNTEPESGKPVSMTFVLTKTTVEGSNTTSEFVATIKFTINSGLKSTSCENLSGTTLPSDVTTQGGVVSMRSPRPEAGKTISYSLLPIEVMQPIDSPSPGEPVATSSLRMSRWFGNVRQSGSDTYDLSQVPNQDHDRIKLRIPIPSKKGQSPVTVRVSTQNCVKNARHLV